MAIETLPKQPTYDYSFNSQFKKRQIMEVGNQPVDYLLLCPPRNKVTSDVPLVIAPGFTENPNLLKKLLKEEYDDGRYIFTLSYPRQRLNVTCNERPQAQDQKIEATLALINEARRFNPANPYEKRDPRGKVDIVGRSDGGVNAALSAAICPDWIYTLTLIDTKLTAPENPLSLTGRFIEHAALEGKEVFRHPFRQKYLIHGIEQAFNYVARHPNQSVQEIAALANSDIRTELSHLREKEIRVYGIHGSGDIIFPMNDLQKGVAETGGKQKDPEILAKIGLVTRDLLIAEPKTLFDGFYSATPNIGHASVYNNDKYVNLISNVIKAARAKSEKDS
jgi:hypothetical protein